MRCILGVHKIRRIFSCIFLINIRRKQFIIFSDIKYVIPVLMYRKLQPVCKKYPENAFRRALSMQCKGKKFLLVAS